MRRFLIPSILAASLLGSCVSGGGDASRLVPRDAYAALVVESPALLFRSAEDFVLAAGLDRFTDGKSLADLLREKAKDEGDMLEAFQALDLGRPMVLTVVPDPAGGEPEAAIVLWLPLKKGKGQFERLRESMTGFEGESAFVAGYAALALNGPAPAALPAKTADLSRLAGYPADSVKGWINVEALRTDFRERWGAALRDAFRSAEGDGTGLLDLEEVEPEDPDAPFNYNERNFDWDEYYGDSGDSSLASTALLGGALGAAQLLEKAAENLRTLDFALGADGRGLYLRAGAVVEPDRALGRLAAAAGPSKGIRYLKYLEADALAGGAASFEPDALADFAKPYVKSLGLEKFLGAQYFDLLDSIYGAMGADSAFSFDMAISSDFMEKAERAQSPQEISELLRRSITLEASGTGSLRDRDRYRSALRQLEGEGLFGDTFRELLGSEGLSLGFTVAQAAVEGIPYDSIRVDLGGEGFGSDPTTEAVLDSLLEKLTIYTGYDKDRYYLALGDPAKLPPAVRRDGAEKPISQDKAYSAFAATLPKATRGVYYLSLKRILELAAPFVKDKSKLPSEGLDRLFGYFAAGKGGLETGLFLGAGDIRTLVDLIPADRGMGANLF